MADRFFHGQFKVFKIHRFGHKVKSTPVHGGPDIIHIAISRHHHRFGKRVGFTQPGKQGQAIHFRHINIAQYNGYIGMLLHLFQCILAIDRKNKFVLLLSYFLAKLLPDKYFQICLIISD